VPVPYLETGWVPLLVRVSVSVRGGESGDEGGEDEEGGGYAEHVV
jgi:hypothetical protein